MTLKELRQTLALINPDFDELPVCVNTEVGFVQIKSAYAAKPRHVLGITPKTEATEKDPTAIILSIYGN